MIKRTITGIVMAGFLFLVLWLTSFSHFVFDALVILVSIIATYEIYSATTGKSLFKKTDEAVIEDRQTYNVSIVPLVISVASCYPLCYFFGYLGLLYSFIIAFIVAFIMFIFSPKISFKDFCVTIFCILYPSTILGIIYILHLSYGIIPVLLGVGISTVSDAMAYFVGSFLGKRKIFPKISPKKTYAGFFGGIIGGAIGGIIVYLIFEFAKFPSNVIFTFTGLFNGSIWQPIVIYIAVGAVMAVFSEIGDLAASRVKREIGIKDYGKILGSHGGILDRIDSILFTTIAMGIIMAIIGKCLGI